MAEKRESHALLGVAVVMLCTFGLWLILGAAAELARLISGISVALAIGFWAMLAER